MSDLSVVCISAVTRDEEAGVLGSHVVSEESEQATQEESLKDGAKTPTEAMSSPAPLSPSYERTDSEIELEIEAELEAMRQAEEVATTSLGVADHDSRLTATVDWSDVSRTSADRSTPKQAKGRLKLTIDSGSTTPTPSHHVESGGRGETGIVTRLPQTVQKKTDDQWADDGWEDFESVVPKPLSPSFSGGKITPSSPSAKGNLSSVTHWSRMKSIEEQPLGAGYDIMLIDVKTKPAEKADEFDFFADMAPEIKPSGSSLMSMLSGGKSEKAAEKSSLASRSLLNQRAAVNTFDVLEAENTVSFWLDVLH